MGFEEEDKRVTRIKKRMCPICGKTEFGSPLESETCLICGWEDDEVQEENPDICFGPNGYSLNDYKEKYESGWRPEWLREYFDWLNGEKRRRDEW